MPRGLGSGTRRVTITQTAKPEPTPAGESLGVTYGETVTIGADESEKATTKTSKTSEKSTTTEKA